MKWLPIDELNEEYENGRPYRVIRADGHKEIVRYSKPMGCWVRITDHEVYHTISMHFDYFCPDIVVPDEVNYEGAFIG